ncbi:hypothetical protein GTO27_00880 [Candidatus Bathyarchaeota archaeon]|nr:hypothetical protein [Candidatus Bathyarchaeota archaeon]
MSWWIWFPTGFKDMVNQWANLGGITENWGPSDDSYIYQTTWRFMVTSSGSIIILHRELDTSSHGHSSGQYVQNYYEEWVHLQLYARFSTNGTGIYRAWFNNNLFIEETNLTNDPAAVLQPGETKVNGDAPTMEVQLYTETDNNEIWFYVDDIVAATEKVQETYEVHDE